MEKINKIKINFVEHYNAIFKTQEILNFRNFDEILLILSENLMKFTRNLREYFGLLESFNYI